MNSAYKQGFRDVPGVPRDRGRIVSAHRFRAAGRRIGCVAVVAVGVMSCAATAQAIEPPQELRDVCVDRRDNVYQVVAPSFCEPGEVAFELPRDRPFPVCAELKFGWLRHVTGASACTAKERALTIPDSGAIYVCAGNLQGTGTLPRGRLRRVDDVGKCDPRAETGYVTPAAPSAVDDAFTVGEDDLLGVPPKGVLSNDKDLTGAPLAASLVSGTSPGALKLRGDGSFAYDPRGHFDELDAGERASDAFRYVADDGALPSAAATATVTIVGRNDAPVATADAYDTDEDTALAVPAAGVLGNDSDAEGHALTAILVSGVSDGRLVLGSDGAVAFDPAGAFESLAGGESAVVSFTYVARDGTSDSTAELVTITVEGRNDAPVAQPNAYATDENTVLQIAAPGVLADDHDAEGQPLQAQLHSGPSAGNLTLNPDGSLRFDPRTAFNALASGQTGRATFTYRALDGGGASSAPVQVSIDVTGISPPTAVDDARSTDEDTPIAIDVLANDTSRGGTITRVEPISGSASAPDADGVITYDPRGAFDGLQDGETGEGSFRYTLTNAEGSRTATVRITVAGRNDAPVARADEYTAAADGTLAVAAPGVLANDTDVDDAPRRAVLVASPARGRLDLHDDGSFEFDLAGDEAGGSVTFAYRASDGRSESATTVVTIHLPEEH